MLRNIHICNEGFPSIAATRAKYLISLTFLYNLSDNKDYIGKIVQLICNQYIYLLLLSIDDEDEFAASVDIVETEQEPTEYTYPSNPHVCFCDLPGYGTPSYPDLETYWKTLELEKFEIFLIFISLRVTALDLAIIKKVKSIKKSFFLIRTKIDVECMVKKYNVQFNEEDLLSKIKDYLVTQTKHLSCAEEDIYLISNYDPYEWDFFRLIQAITSAMPSPEIGEYH